MAPSISGLNGENGLPGDDGLVAPGIATSDDPRSPGLLAQHPAQQQGEPPSPISKGKLTKPTPVGTAAGVASHTPGVTAVTISDTATSQTASTSSPPPTTQIRKTLALFGRVARSSDAKDVAVRTSSSGNTQEPATNRPRSAVDTGGAAAQKEPGVGTVGPSGSENPRPTSNQPPPAANSSVAAPTSSVDPLTQHIFVRTNTDNSLSSSRLRPHPPRPESPGAADEPAAASAESAAKSPAPPADAARERKKGGSILSRLSMRPGKRKNAGSIPDTDSELSEQQRPDGSNAPAFTGVAGGGGFIPHHKEPPRYIRVKIQYKKAREFSRLFLAQELVPGATTASSVPVTNAKTAQTEAVGEEKAEAQGAESTGVKDDPNRKPVGGRRRNAVWAAEFSRDGRYLATAGQSSVIQVWAVLSASDERRADGDDVESATGTSAAALKEKLSAPVFREMPVREFARHESDVLDLSWSKNNFLLSSSMDKTVRLWHLSRKECLCTFKHKDIVTKIAFHPTDDRFFLAGSLESVLRLWSIPDKAVAFSAQLPDMVTAVAFSPDGKTAIAGVLSGHCNFYETEGLKFQSQIHVRSSRGKNAKGSKITGIQTMLIPAIQTIPSVQRPRSSGSSRPEITITSPASTTTLGTVEHQAGHVKVLITSNDSRIRIYDLKDKSLDAKFKGHENSFSQIAARFSDDGKYVICGSENSKAFIWSLDRLAAEPNKDKWPCEWFEASGDVVTVAIFAPTRTRMILDGSGDPIYDLCNPPPVTLLSVEDMGAEARRSTTALSEVATPTTEPSAASTQQPSKMPANDQSVTLSPAYMARSTHYDGNIIVTAADVGSIKVFRQDCAFAKRRNDWETSSFGRKLTGPVQGSAAYGIGNLPLGRSASILTRTSVSSAAHSRRGSLSLGHNGSIAQAGGPSLAVGSPPPGGAGSSDRILSWRQAIEGAGPGQRGSVASTPTTRSERSVSPGKSGRGSAANLAQITNPASEARKLPYVQQGVTSGSAASSPTVALFTPRFGPRTKGNGATDKAGNGLAKEDKEDHEILTGESEDLVKLDEAKRKPQDRATEADSTKEEAPAQPPIPSFTFRPIDDDSDPLRLDPAGASYSFWNLNRWKGSIASLRGSPGGTAGGPYGKSTNEPAALGTPVPGFTSLQTVRERDGNNSPEIDLEKPKEKDKGPNKGRSERRKSSSGGKTREQPADEDRNAAPNAAEAMAPRKPGRRKSTPPLTATLAQTLSNVLPSILSPSTSSKSTTNVVQAPDFVRAAADEPDEDDTTEYVDAPETEAVADTVDEPKGEDNGREGTSLAPPDDSRRASYVHSRGSAVSKLSDEFTSSDGEEMRCTQCGSKEFKARRIGGRQKLICGTCGALADQE